jgi:hypothetical protein
MPRCSRRACNCSIDLVAGAQRPRVDPHVRMARRKGGEGDGEKVLAHVEGKTEQQRCITVTCGSPTKLVGGYG